jgi:hypothetical protein
MRQAFLGGWLKSGITSQKLRAKLKWSERDLAILLRLGKQLWLRSF